MVKKKRLLVKWGKGSRRILVNPKLYKRIGKVGRFVLYKRKTKAELKKGEKKKGKKLIGKPNKYKRVRKQQRTRRSKEELEVIARIKGQKPTTLSENKALENSLLKKVSFIPTVDTKKYRRAVNPKGKIVFSQKSYSSFEEMASDKSSIYKSIVMNEALKNESKVWDNIFRLRRKIFKDGFVMKVDLYGSISKGVERTDYFLGSIDVAGVLPDDVGFLENEVKGSTGYLHEINKLLDNLVRGRGGKGSNLSSDNTKNIQVTVNKVRINYSFA
jgi:hypothetical protein